MPRLLKCSTLLSRVAEDDSWSCMAMEILFELLAQEILKLGTYRLMILQPATGFMGSSANHRIETDLRAKEELLIL
jgi:hypothetical protein